MRIITAMFTSAGLGAGLVLLTVRPQGAALIALLGAGALLLLSSILRAEIQEDHTRLTREAVLRRAARESARESERLASTVVLLRERCNVLAASAAFSESVTLPPGR